MSDAIDDVDDDDTQPDVENSVLGVSDEEFLTMTPPPVEESSSPEVPSTPAASDNEAIPDKAVEGDVTQSPDKEAPTGADTPDDATKATADAEKKEDTPAAEAKKDDVVIDYKAEYEKLMAPFKANGAQVQAKSIDDAMSLMQMGANYHKKMAGLKPSLKIVKLLEKHDLLDADKISYLIDLHTKNPEAITKLMKDSGLDPLNVDTEKESTYVPKSRTVSDTELELDSVLESIQDTPTYAKTLNVLVEKWDVASRNVIAGNPHIISIINEQMASGIFDQVADAVAHERVLGRLQGLSDLDAYKQMGDRLEAQGLFAHQKATPAATIKTPVDDSARRDRKKAVSPTRSSSPQVTAVATNPLAMSDEEFEKTTIKHFK